MQQLAHDLLRLWQSQEWPRLTSLLILWASVLAIASSVAWKFEEYRRTSRTVTVRKISPVATISMTAVIVGVAVILQRGVGEIPADPITRAFLLIFGGVLVVIATVLHIWAKVNLGRFWSDQIEIQEGHVLVTTGAYSVARHPMYASLLMWQLGLSLAFINGAALLAVLLVFLPMMVVRARAEDRLLRAADPAAFLIYSQKTSSLIPHLPESVTLGLRLLVIGFLGYFLAAGEMTLQRVVFLWVAHLVVGLVSAVPKVRFSFINKSFILLAIFGLTRVAPAAALAYWLILLFDIWGLKFNCPCMMVYEKYHGCPCFGWLKRGMECFREGTHGQR